MWNGWVFSNAMLARGARTTVLTSVAVLCLACQGAAQASGDGPSQGASEVQQLPAARTDGTMSLETAILRRRSQRVFARGPFSVEEVGQLLWAAQGTTEPSRGLRAAPSAGALYPLELYVVDVVGIWHYESAPHRLVRIRSGDHRPALAHAAFDQSQVATAAVAIVISGVVQRTSAKYGGRRAERYMQIEAGHAAQNALLEATALDLAAVPVGAFDDDAVRRVLGVAEMPLYILCLGHTPGKE